MKVLAIKSVFSFFICALCLMTAVQAAPIFNQAQIDDAMAQKLIGYTSVGTSPSTVMSAQAFHYLALATHFSPDATDSKKNPLKERALAHYRNLISGGKEPYCGQPLYGWSDGAVGQSLLIIKYTPELWSALSLAEQSDADLLMRALAIANNWAFNDKNNFKTGLGNEGNFQKTYNPNYVQGGIGIMIAAALYFGADECNAIFTNFSYQDYIKQFQVRKWTNIIKNWSATGQALMEKGGKDKSGGTGVGVKLPFVYCGFDLHHLNEIFYATSVAGGPKPMYSLTVSNTGAKGKAYIISKKSSPVVGQKGMCYEFESVDSGGARSDALYSYEGWMNSVGTRASMMLMGVWGGPNQTETEARMSVGSADLIFKLREGYHGVYLKKTRDIYDTGLPAGKGFFYNKDIWESYVNADGSINPTPPPTPPSPPTPPPVPSGSPNVTVQSGSILVTFRVDKDWKSEYSGSITLTNTGNKAINQWALSLDLASDIGKIWNAKIADYSGKTYTFLPESWNAKIAPGKKVSFGFNAAPGNLTTPPSNINVTVQ
jgi:hypothetical protein